LSFSRLILTQLPTAVHWCQLSRYRRRRVSPGRPRLEGLRACYEAHAGSTAPGLPNRTKHCHPPTSLPVRGHPIWCPDSGSQFRLTRLAIFDPSQTYSSPISAIQQAVLKPDFANLICRTVEMPRTISFNGFSSRRFNDVLEIDASHALSLFFIYLRQMNGRFEYQFARKMEEIFRI